MESLKTTRQTKLYLLQQELDALKDDMADAMQQANPPYIAKEGRMTMHMDTVWEKYKAWARRYVEGRASERL